MGWGDEADERNGVPSTSILNADGLASAALQIELVLAARGAPAVAPLFVLVAAVCVDLAFVVSILARIAAARVPRAEAAGVTVRVGPTSCVDTRRRKLTIACPNRYGLRKSLNFS